MITEAERDSIFRNSLAEGGEEDWVCPICDFENRPRMKNCCLCGTSREFAIMYNDMTRSGAVKASKGVDTSNSLNSR